MWEHGSRMTVWRMSWDSKQMQHSRLLGSTRSGGVTDTSGSWRMAFVAAGGGARDGSLMSCCCCWC
jgi:hypothetical protein